MADLMPGAVRAPDRPDAADAARRAALRDLLAAGEDGRSFVVLTGAAGSGKTVVLGRAAALLGRPPVQVVRADPGGEALSSRRLIELIAGAAGANDPAEAIELALERLLMPQAPCTRTILLIDDAHLLLHDALNYLQITSGLQEAARLQIMFAARPEFGLLRESDKLRRLREKIGLRISLDAPPPEPPPALAAASSPRHDFPEAAAALRAAPGSALTTLPPRRAVLPVLPAIRVSARHYGLASGVAAALVLVSLAPVARDPPSAPPRQVTQAAPVLLAAAQAPAPAAEPPPSPPPAAAPPAVMPPPPETIVPPPLQPVSPAPAPPPPRIQATPPKPPPPAATGRSAPPPPPARREAPVPAPRPAAAAPASSVATLPAPMIAALLDHGDDMLKLGDIGAARLLYRRAAEAGSAEAALAIGRTFDPDFLAQIGAAGILPDPQAAAAWYRRAAALGSRAASRRLSALAAIPAH